MTEANTLKKDWVHDYRSYVVAWGLPTAMLIVASFIEPISRTIVWAAALTWMGVACLANAKRCRRTHCYFTGPFFLFMAVLVVLHGFSIVALGAHGWWWLGFGTALGAGLIWYLTERTWGKRLH